MPRSPNFPNLHNKSTFRLRPNSTFLMHKISGQTKNAITLEQKTLYNFSYCLVHYTVMKEKQSLTPHVLQVTLSTTTQKKLIQKALITFLKQFRQRLNKQINKLTKNNRATTSTARNWPPPHAQQECPLQNKVRRGNPLRHKPRSKRWKVYGSSIQYPNLKKKIVMKF